MERRKFLIGAGSLAAGGAAAIGTGALDTVQAERGMAVDVAGDSAAYLGIKPHTDSRFVETTNSAGQVKIDFASNSNGGKGVNTDAVTAARPAYTLKNQTNKDLYVEVNNPLRNPKYKSSETNKTFASDGDIEVPAGVDVQMIAATQNFLNPTSSSSNSVALIDRDTFPKRDTGANADDPSGNFQARTVITPNYSNNYQKLNNDDVTGHLVMSPGQSIGVIARVVVNSDFYKLSDPTSENEIFSGQFLAVEAYGQQNATTLAEQENIPGL